MLGNDRIRRRLAEQAERKAALIPSGICQLCRKAAVEPGTSECADCAEWVDELPH